VVNSRHFPPALTREVFEKEAPKEEIRASYEKEERRRRRRRRKKKEFFHLPNTVIPACPESCAVFIGFPTSGNNKKYLMLIF